MNRTAKICVCLFAAALMGACEHRHDGHHWKMEKDEHETLNLKAPIGVPEDADLIWYGTGAPSDIAAPGSGTLYVVDESAARVVRVVYLGDEHEDVSFDDESGFDKGSHYRVYFVENENDDEPKGPPLVRPFGEPPHGRGHGFYPGIKLPPGHPPIDGDRGPGPGPKKGHHPDESDEKS